MNDITSKALQEIKKLGVTHVWYTGIIEHATQTDYTAYGIRKDHPAVVKGKAGSPYAIKDYYDIDPDLAKDPKKRFEEFNRLVQRTHKTGLKVIIDFVPNHVAREYHSDHAPKNTLQLGESDNKTLNFSANNNFYYLNAPLQCQFDMHGGSSVAYEEQPAKVTGNDCFSPSPTRNDWYETVKLNYGIDYLNNHHKHFDPIPDTWFKMRDILLFWASYRIDGFRCDMAEMVPCEFWNWVIPIIKKEYPDIIFIAEVYNPQQYRNYIHNGHFDYLYDKVGLYDTLRAVTCGQQAASAITSCWQNVDDIRTHMLNFLENHDEQRIASDYFIADGMKAIPALIVSSCISTQPFMLYSGQELGERGMDAEGFSGKDGCTSIFDYWSVKTLREWNNNGKFDGALLSCESQKLRKIYQNILTLLNQEKALSKGLFFDLMYVNYDNTYFCTTTTYAFIRSYQEEHILIVVNFSERDIEQHINIPQHAFDFLKIKEDNYNAIDLLSGTDVMLKITPNVPCAVHVPAYSGVMLKFNVSQIRG